MKKYLLYALGEIVLIVAGILIALQINAWSNENAERREEAKLLAEINREFRSNRAQLDTLITINQEAYRAGNHLISMLPLPAETWAIDTVYAYFTPTFKHISFNPSDGTVSSLISSSRFHVIQDDTLRRYLISWQDRLEDYLEEEEAARKHAFETFMPEVHKRSQLGLVRSQKNIDFVSSDFFANHLLVRVSMVNNILHSMKSEGLLEAVDEIIRLSESEADQ